MNKKELFEFINDLKGDLEFEYKGIHGAICPFNRSKIAVTYNGEDKEYTSVEDVMRDPFYDGRCLNDISMELDIY